MNLFHVLLRKIGVRVSGQGVGAPTDPALLEVALQAVRREIDEDPDGYLNRTEALEPNDFALMGRLVQDYCYADLNARRVIDAIKHAALGPEHRNAGVLQDKQVFEEFQKVVEKLPSGQMKDGLAKAGKTIEMHLQLRHFFAHWAARRVKGLDALVLFTKNSKEGSKKSGLERSAEHLIYVIVPLGALRTEMRKLEGHGLYLADRAADLEAHFDDWQCHYDKIKESARLAKYEAGKTKKRNRGRPA